MTVRKWLVGLVLSIATVACSRQTGGPAGTLDAYARALRQGDYVAAYGLMTEEFRSHHSREEFVKMMKENSQEAQETAQRLTSPYRSAETTAEFRYGLGDAMRLVQRDGRWWVATNPAMFYSMASPRAALRSFVRAYRLKRWEILYRLAPKIERDYMTVEKLKKHFIELESELDEIMAEVEANLERPIEVKGNEARMPYGGRKEVIFVREDGLWRIKDPDAG